MKLIRLLAALALACAPLCVPVCALAQTMAPTFIQGSQVKTAPGVFIVDKTGVPFGTPGNPFNIAGSATTTPSYTTPVAYTSGTTFDARAYGTVILTCTAAPSSGAISVSPDNNGDFIAQTAVLNNASGIITTASINAAGVYSISGHQYVQATFVGGTCFIAGAQ